MTNIIFLKIAFVSLMWTCAWVWYFVEKVPAPNLKTVYIAFAPWVLMIFYFLLFVW